MQGRPHAWALSERMIWYFLVAVFYVPIFWRF